MANLDVKNIGLDTSEVKNRIFKYLYSAKVNMAFNFDEISTTEDLETIKDGDYIICPRYAGVRSWILFFHIDNQYYSVNFPKHGYAKRDSIKIHPIDVSVTKYLHRGTIMEGIYYSKEDESGIKRYLVIDEVYILAGENQMIKSKENRLNYLSKILSENMRLNPYYNISVSKYYEIDEANLEELFGKIRQDERIQEIIFYPKLYGKKIFNYTLVEKDLEETVIQIDNFYLQKTDRTDIYILYKIDDRTKVGIAHLPTMAQSKKCKKWFTLNKTNEIIVKCQYDSNVKKWIPLEMIETDDE